MTAVMLDLNLSFVQNVSQKDILYRNRSSCQCSIVIDAIVRSVQLRIVWTFLG